jgi:hypothetical protein
MPPRAAVLIVGIPILTFALMCGAHFRLAVTTGNHPGPMSRLFAYAAIIFATIKR